MGRHGRASVEEGRGDRQEEVSFQHCLFTLIMLTASYKLDKVAPLITGGAGQERSWSEGGAGAGRGKRRSPAQGRVVWREPGVTAI